MNVGEFEVMGTVKIKQTKTNKQRETPRNLDVMMLKGEEMWMDKNIDNYN